MSGVEFSLTVPCFGGSCSIIVAGDGHLGPARAAAHTVSAVLLDWHHRFTRFSPDSELSRLNADPRATVPVSPLLARLSAAVADAGRASGGLVDGTLIGAVEAAGYTETLHGPAVPLADALAGAPARRPAGPSPHARWASIEVDHARGTVTRAPGVRLDSGGLAKGLFADVVAQELTAYDRFVVNLCGDLRLGGVLAEPRDVEVESPFAHGEALYVFGPADGAVATSGIGRRSWRDAHGALAHHLLDPSTGRPAFTGIVQATALAPTGVEAEWRAKAAVLSGPDGAAAHLRHGGLLVFDDGSTSLIAPPRVKPKIRVARRGGRLELAGVGVPA